MCLVLLVIGTAEWNVNDAICRVRALLIVSKVSNMLGFAFADYRGK